jgi:hypothetical protein
MYFVKLLVSFCSILLWWLIWYIVRCVDAINLYHYRLFVLSLATTRQSAKRCVVALCLAVLSLAKHAKRHIVVRRVVPMSTCRLAYKPILRFESRNNVTSRQHAARQRVRTTRRKSDNAPFGTKAFQIRHHILSNKLYYLKVLTWENRLNNFLKYF